MTRKTYSSFEQIDQELEILALEKELEKRLQLLWQKKVLI